jgi:hypothetical protein
LAGLPSRYMNEGGICCISRRMKKKLLDTWYT